MHPGLRADRSARHPAGREGEARQGLLLPPAGSAGCPRACLRLAVKGSGAGTPRPAPLPPQEPSQL